jgi:hypothetical protein
LHALQSFLLEANLLAALLNRPPNHIASCCVYRIAGQQPRLLYRTEVSETASWVLTAVAAVDDQPEQHLEDILTT